MPVGLKGKVYRMVVRPAVLYGLGYEPIKKDTNSNVNGSRDKDD